MKHPMHSMWLDGNLYIFLFTGIKLTLEYMQDNGVILVFTDAGTKQKRLEKEIRKLSEKKNIKIFFLFSPRCRAKCENSLPVYKRLSDGMFNLSDMYTPKEYDFFNSFLDMVCNLSPCTCKIKFKDRISDSKQSGEHDGDYKDNENNNHNDNTEPNCSSDKHGSIGIALDTTA